MKNLNANDVTLVSGGFGAEAFNGMDSAIAAVAGLGFVVGAASLVLFQTVFL